MSIESETSKGGKEITSDPSSWANFAEVFVVHHDFNFAVDFQTKTLKGSVDYQLSVVEDGKPLILDIKGQTIHKVEVKSGNYLYAEVKNYSVEHKDNEIGAALVIPLPPKSDSISVRVHFETSADASGLQWLPKEQTAGQVHPYLFTQNQAIHARSMIPCQDTPSVKSTYNASVCAPNPLQVLMSAVLQTKTDDAAAQGHSRFEFVQKIPIPSYLVALAVGALEKRDISHRCAVWSEKEFVDQGAYEFANTEKFVTTAESICGPYVWGRYDILLLPPSFPYGGMENPCLTFVTPTLLAGDRSLESVIAHEIAHSWMGNGVTNQTWDHFWMNEGFTVFVERKIIKAMFGGDLADLHACEGWTDLKDSIDMYGHDHTLGWEHLKGSVDLYGCEHNFTKLIPGLAKNVDPDDAFSSVPYEKGFNFLSYLQTVVGGEKVMDAYLKEHVKRYAGKTVTTWAWKEFFLDYMSMNAEDPKRLGEIDWDTWFNKPGMPQKPLFGDKLAAFSKLAATGLVDICTADAVDECKVEALFKQTEVATWKSASQVVFLDALLGILGSTKHASSVWDNVLKVLAKFSFNESNNCEIKFRFLTLHVRLEKKECLEDACKFAISYGRMKFCRPMFRDLYKSEMGKKAAVETFVANASFFHNIAKKMIAKDLNVKL